MINMQAKEVLRGKDGRKQRNKRRFSYSRVEQGPLLGELQKLHFGHCK